MQVARVRHLDKSLHGHDGRWAKWSRTPVQMGSLPAEHGECSLFRWADSFRNWILPHDYQAT